MGKIFNKFLDAIGLEVNEEEIVENDSSWPESDRVKRQKKGNLVSLPTQRPVTMMLVKANSFDEVENIAQNIKERRSVIVNFDETEKETAQRMIDFLSGTVFALEGTVQKVSQNTFLFATSNLDVIGQIIEDDKEKTIFKGFVWNKNKA
ncbi:MAG: cell division protein SepF [Bacillota bacterium]|nr:cell division protein SepF [Clostridia bacterium]